MRLGLPCRWDLTNGECSKFYSNLTYLTSSSDIGNNLDLPTYHLVRRIWWVLYVSIPPYSVGLSNTIFPVPRRVVLTCRV